MTTFYYFFCNISGFSKNISEIEKTYGSTFKIEMFRDETNPDLWKQRTLPDGTGYKAYPGSYINRSMLEQIKCSVFLWDFVIKL